MQKALLIKALTTMVLALLLLIPLGMIDDLISERRSLQYSSSQEIQTTYAGPQTLTGPVLVLPYRERWTLERWTLEKIRPGGESPAPDNGVGEPRRQQLTRQPAHRDGQLVIYPEHLSIDGDLPTRFKSRGLYRTPVYQLNAQIRARFQLDSKLNSAKQRSDSTLEWGTPYLAMPISDPRGINGLPTLRWHAGEPEWTDQRWQQGTGLNHLGTGIHAAMTGFQPKIGKQADVEIGLALNGSTALDFVPLGSHTQVSMQSNWPHPSFQGRFLPNASNQSVTDDGFNADWSITALSSDAAKHFTRMINGGDCSGSCLDKFGIELIEPVNLYRLLDRALKYAFLFVSLGFAAFFLVELIKGLRIHPAQYLLVGLSLAVFFLLLLGLSEHIGFGFAYLTAGAASTALQGYYLSHVLNGWQRGLSFAGTLAGLLAALYGLLMSEDNSLLMGSLLLFVLLAIAMVSTRRIDWYALPELGSASASQTPDRENNEPRNTITPGKR